MSGPDRIGYGRPPHATRFKPGQSGNPRGRPKNRRQDIPHNTVLGRMVTIREDAREHRVTAAEAFLLHLTQKGLAGDSRAARASLEAIETARAKRQAQHDQPRSWVVQFVGSGIETIIGTLGLAKKMFATDRDRVRWEIEPWIVEAALERFGDRRLTEAEQHEVWKNVRTPSKVRWPKWWTVKD